MTSVDDFVEKSLKDLSKTPQVRFSGDLLIAIGDFHGHYPALETLIGGLHKKYGIFKDEKKQVLHDNVMLVFTGDYIDRGDSGLQVIKRLMELAKKNSSQVETLMGNHELMALAGRDYAAELLENWEQGYTADLLYNYSIRCLHGSNGGDIFVNEFGEDEESAFRSYINRMSKQGDIGRWMRDLKPCFLTEFNKRNILFTHADIPEDKGTRSGVLRAKERISKHWMTSTTDLGGSEEKYGNEELLGENTFFWDRHFRELSDSAVSDIVERLKVDYLVVGHTRHNEITTYGGKIFDVDVGMTPYYGENEPAALVFKPNGIHAFYSQKGESLLREL